MSDSGMDDAARSRRRFLQRVGIGGSTLAALPFLGGIGVASAAKAAEVDGTESSDGAAQFLHGVASGDPLTDRVMLWTRITTRHSGKIYGRYIVASDVDMKHVVTRGSYDTDASRDFTVKVDCGGLQPGTTYFYRFRALGVESPVGRTRTAPEGPVSHLRMAFTSCAQYRDGYFNVYAAMARREDLDCILFLGDYIYEYGGQGELGAVHAPEPPHDTVTLADYRTRYAQYRRDPDLQHLHAIHPWIVVWDDHESANNSWMGGAENHDPSTEGPWKAREAASIQAYYEWLPIRETEPGRRERIYRKFGYGDLVDLIMLDTRLIGRDEQADSPVDVDTLGDDSRTMLGFEQEAWLNGQLARSVAQWKLIGQQVMFMPLRLGLPKLVELNLLPALDKKLEILKDGGIALNVDQWDGYPKARQRLLDQVHAQGLQNFVVLSGDIHTSWAQDISSDPNNPLRYGPITGRGSMGVEFVSPSVTSSGLPELQPVKDSLRVLNPHERYVDLAHHGYVLLDITAERLQGEFWFVDTISERNPAETFAAAFYTAAGEDRLRRADGPSVAKAVAGATSLSSSVAPIGQIGQIGQIGSL